VLFEVIDGVEGLGESMDCLEGLSMVLRLEYSFMMEMEEGRGYGISVRGGWRMYRRILSRCFGLSCI
jgi:hypothetical protein